MVSSLSITEESKAILKAIIRKGKNDRIGSFRRNYKAKYSLEGKGEIERRRLEVEDNIGRMANEKLTETTEELVFEITCL